MGPCQLHVPSTHSLATVEPKFSANLARSAGPKKGRIEDLGRFRNVSAAVRCINEGHFDRVLHVEAPRMLSLAPADATALTTQDYPLNDL